jgi:hypothetical protein
VSGLRTPLFLPACGRFFPVDYPDNDDHHLVIENPIEGSMRSLIASFTNSHAGIPV